MRWYPAKDTYSNNVTHPSRDRAGVEGFYLLSSMPHVEAGHLVPPAAFSALSAAKCNTILNEVREAFKYQPDVLASWNRWYDLHAPHSDNVDDYIRRLHTRQSAFSVPLRIKLLNAKYVNNFISHWSKSCLEDNNAEIDPGFVWPSLLAAAMPSVVSQFDIHPPEPRLFVVQHGELQQLLNRYNETTAKFYNSKPNTIPKLSKCLTLKVDASGVAFTSTGKFHSICFLKVLLP